MSRIGIAGSGQGFINSKKSVIYIKDGGKIIIEGTIGLSRNVYLEAKGGTIKIGNGFKTNVNCHISSEKSSIVIGRNVVFGWDCCVKNCDGHTLIVDGSEIENNKDVTIGDNCWICSRSTILKGGYLGDWCVLAYGSILTKKVSDNSNLLYAGVPAKIVKENIKWSV